MSVTTTTHPAVEDFLAMVNTRDADRVDTHCTFEHIDHNPVVPNGREANRLFWKNVFAAFPDITATVKDLLVCGDRVAGRFEYEGTHQGEFLGIPATYRKVQIRSIDIWRLEDGLFAEHWDQTNLTEVLQELRAAAHA
ncbi:MULTISPECIES: ester cyclase [Streptomyces]|uniref:ester cyclase n=1 Tax=Streptomyces TaxID=1883 RepID=UPI000F6BC383|nr:ester cyclase [Streptomyces sp. W1SF4]AZM90821.1 ester cyclase [Streptomyces sp. W1SF4]